MGDEQLWGTAVGAWVPLEDLCAVVEREMDIPRAEAAKALREPLESLRIHAEMTDWHRPTYSSRVAPEYQKWVYPTTALARKRVSGEGWRHVDWAAGTLDGFGIEVRWQHVHAALLGTVVKLANARRKAASTAQSNNAGASADWSINEAIAWIMFRDAEIVSDVHRSTAVRFAVRIAVAMGSGKGLLVPDMNAADRLLFERLRSAGPIASGRPGDGTEISTIPSSDWRDAKKWDHEVAIEVRREGYDAKTIKTWRDVTIPREWIVAKWPRPITAGGPPPSPQHSDAESNEATNNKHESTATKRAAGTSNPSFNEKQAKGLLLGQKHSGVWPTAPTEMVTKAFLKPHFKGIPNDDHRRVRKEVWPNIKRGRKPKSHSAN